MLWRTDRLQSTCTDDLEAAGTRVAEAEAELASKHALVQSLEEDLLAAQKGTATMGEPLHEICNVPEF